MENRNLGIDFNQVSVKDFIFCLKVCALWDVQVGKMTQVEWGQWFQIHEKNLQKYTDDDGIEKEIPSLTLRPLNQLTALRLNPNNEHCFRVFDPEFDVITIRDRLST